MTCDAEGQLELEVSKASPVGKQDKVLASDLSLNQSMLDSGLLTIQGLGLVFSCYCHLFFI